MCLIQCLILLCTTETHFCFLTFYEAVFYVFLLKKTVTCSLVLVQMQINFVGIFKMLGSTFSNKYIKTGITEKYDIISLKVIA